MLGPRQILRKTTIAVGPFVEKVLARLIPYTYKNIELANALNRQNQIFLKSRYSAIRDGSKAALPFSEVEFRAYSQNGEDGILLYIFSLIGIETNKSVEICAGNGIECNSANLVINHGWQGLMIDGDADNVRQGVLFYNHCKSTTYWPPVLKQAWVTAENVNSLIEKNGFAGEVDLLSLDLDGVDYWIWNAIDVLNPRVVVVEYNHLWGPNRAVTVPYQPNFRATFGRYGADYSGASLSAFVKLARARGLRLVGCQAYGTNAFFVRNGVREDLLPEIETQDCFQHPRALYGMDKRLPRVVDLEWLDV